MLIEWINKLNQQQVNRVGSKISLLSELQSMSSKFVVPQAFILTTQIVEDFLKENNLHTQIDAILAEVDLEDMNRLQEAYAQIKELILNAHFNKNQEQQVCETYKQIGMSEELRKYGKTMDLVSGRRDNQPVAIRASPMAGANVYKSILNVIGKESVIMNIKECIASYYSPEAIIYRKNIKESSGLSILVQKMIISEKSVSVFTANPLGNSSEIVVEAVWGLGASLKQGITSPDQYKIDKNSGQLVKEQINVKEWLFTIDSMSNQVIKERVSSELRTRSVLTTKELQNVVESALLIESKVNVPYKLDFSINRGKLSLLGIEKAVSQDTSSLEEFNEETLLIGSGSSAGSCTGLAKVIYDCQDISNLNEQDILVTVNPSLEFLPAITKIQGIITDEGSMSCKLASILREIGMPLITSTKNSTELLNSTEISMNGLTGTISEKPIPQSSEPSSKNFDSVEMITGIEVKTIGIQKIPGSDGAVVIDHIGFEAAKNLALDHASGSIWMKSAAAGFDFDTSYYENYNSLETLPENVEFINTDFHTINQNPQRAQGIVLKDFTSLMQLEDYLSVLNFVVIDLNNLSRSFGHAATHPAVLNSIKKVHEVCKDTIELSILLESMNPKLIERLIEIGADSFVVHPEDFNKIKAILMKKERKFMIKKLRKL